VKTKTVKPTKTKKAEAHELTERELKQKLRALGQVSEEQKKSIVCSLIGHSKIQSACFGYFSCGRCGDQVGDSLASIYDASNVVIIGHNCEKYRENFQKLTWRDKFMAPDEAEIFGK